MDKHQVKKPVRQKQFKKRHWAVQIEKWTSREGEKRDWEVLSSCMQVRSECLLKAK